jgi:hypothetical protein
VNTKIQKTRKANRTAIVFFSCFLLLTSYLTGCQYTIDGNPDIDLTEVHVSPVAATVSFNGGSLTLTGGRLMLTASVLGFSSSANVTWSVDGTNMGTIIANGSSAIYTAPPILTSFNEIANIRVTSVEDPNRSVICPVSIISPTDTAFSVAPSSVTLLTNSVQQFLLDTFTTQSAIPPVRWEATSGSISDSGVFTAPATITADSLQIVVRAISMLDSTVFSQSTITILNSADSSLCFTRDILPMLSANCGISGCHDATTRAAGDNYTTYEGTLHAVERGNARSSRLFTAITQFNVNSRMPPPPAPAMAPNQVLKIGQWINEGAIDCQ